MMKRKILAVTIPVVGCITVVGAGFSAWYFSDVPTRGESSALNIHVTDKVEGMDGVLNLEDSNKDTVLNNRYLILDQGGFKNTDPLAGIMIADDEVNETVKDDRTYSFKVKFDGTGSKGLTLNKLYDANMKLSVTVEIDLSDKLFQYVTLVDGASMGVKYTDTGEDPDKTVPFKDAFVDTDEKNKKWTATYTLEKENLSELASEDISSFVWTFTINLSTSETLENSLFRYVNNDVNMKPVDGPAYDNMVKALGLGEGGTPGTLDFVTTAKIGAVA